MSITDRVEPNPLADDAILDFLTKYEMQRLAFVRILDFVKKINNGSHILDSNKLIWYEGEAKEILEEFGEDLIK